MSSNDIIAGVDYTKTKRHYETNDFVMMPFDGTQDYYPVGAMAFFNNQAIFDVTKGWALYAHGQAAAPIFFAAMGLPWPAAGPGFEAKRVLIRTSTTARVRFGGITNVEHTVFPGQEMEFWQRAFVIFVRHVATAGSAWITFEG